jgi:hypothetical protein
MWRVQPNVVARGSGAHGFRRDRIRFGGREPPAEPVTQAYELDHFCRLRLLAAAREQVLRGVQNRAVWSPL